MGRIPKCEIERLKAEVSVQRLAEAAGVVLAPRGEDLVGSCPFHGGTEPSLVITPSKNLWNCLGACGTGGSAIEWVMKARGLSFRHAVELLRADQYPVAAGEPVQPVRRSSVRTLPPPVAEGADEGTLLAQVVSYYHDAFKSSPEAQKYLQRRGLMNSEMVERFRIGFSNRTLGYRLPEKNRAAGERLRGSLRRIGILKDTGHEYFNGSVLFPVFGVKDESGQTDYENVTGIYGRKITHCLRKGTPTHLYLPGPHRGVWNEQAVAASSEIILCEAIIDALTFWCAGFRNVTSSYSVDGFTDDHLAAFKKYGTKRVLIAYDRDDAGEKAAAALAEKLLAVGLDCYRVQFPQGMDANEYALHMGSATRTLGNLLRNAVWMGKGKPRQARIGAGGITADVEEKAEERKAAGPAVKEEPRVSTPAADPAPAKPPSEAPASPPRRVAAPSFTDVKPPGTPPPGRDPVLPPAGLPAEPPEIVAAPVPDSPSPAASVVVPELPAASPEPSAPRVPDVPTTVTAEEVVITLGDRRYRVRGLSKNNSFDAMKVNLLCSRGEGFYVDTFDLYAARPRALFTKAAAAETGTPEETIRKDLGRVLLRLEELQDEQIRKSLEPKTPSLPQMTDAERDAALSLLKAPHLLDRILADFTRCGIVGEETNKLVGYLCAVSRKLDDPLAVVIRSTSAAGKSALMEAILAFVPPEERVTYSAVTGQSLFYMGETDLKHKILAVVEEEGVRQAAYALKILQSEGELTIASTGKDAATGKLVTHEYRVEGPVMIFLTTTAVEIDEELLSRCIVLTVNEDRDQTRAIHRLQRERQTLEGLLARQDREEVLALHRNAQRLLRPLLVSNPYARRLTFLDDRTRTRRDHVKYLALIRSIAFLHQHQREVKSVLHGGRRVEYVEVALDDIATANRLAHEVLGRSLDDLSPQTRRLLFLLDEMVAQEIASLAMDRCDYRFSRRQVRRHTGWSDFQVRIHLDKLVALEYVLVHRGGRGRSFVYELLYDGQGQDGSPHLTGLIDVGRLGDLPECGYDEKFEGQNRNFEGAKGRFEGGSSPQRALIEPPSRVPRNASEPAPGAGLTPYDEKTSKNAHRGEGGDSSPYAYPHGYDGPAGDAGRPPDCEGGAPSEAPSHSEKERDEAGIPSRRPR